MNQASCNQSNIGRVFCVLFVIGFSLIAIACGGGRRAKTGAAAPDAKIYKAGDELVFDDSKWVVLQVEDMGKKITPKLGAPKETHGRFILVHFKVTNTTDKERRLVFAHPKLIDAKNREFKRYDHQARFIPKEGYVMNAASLPAGLTKEFYAIYEIPEDAAELKFQARDLTSTFSPATKLVALGQ